VFAVLLDHEYCMIVVVVVVVVVIVVLVATVIVVNSMDCSCKIALRDIS
jgi:hypothetical protein